MGMWDDALKLVTTPSNIVKASIPGARYYGTKAVLGQSGKDWIPAVNLSKPLYNPSASPSQAATPQVQGVQRVAGPSQSEILPSGGSSSGVSGGGFNQQ